MFTESDPCMFSAEGRINRWMDGMPAEIGGTGNSDSYARGGNVFRGNDVGQVSDRAQPVPGGLLKVSVWLFMSVGWRMRIPFGLW